MNCNSLISYLYSESFFLLEGLAPTLAEVLLLLHELVLVVVLLGQAAEVEAGHLGGLLGLLRVLDLDCLESVLAVLGWLVGTVNARHHFGFEVILLLLKEGVSGLCVEVGVGVVVVIIRVLFIVARHSLQLLSRVRGGILVLGRRDFPLHVDLSQVQLRHLNSVALDDLVFLPVQVGVRVGIDDRHHGVVLVLFEQLIVLLLQQGGLLSELGRLLQQLEEGALALVGLLELDLEALVDLLELLVVVVERVELIDEFLVVFKGEVALHLLNSCDFILVTHQLLLQLLHHSLQSLVLIDELFVLLLKAFNSGLSRVRLRLGALVVRSVIRNDSLHNGLFFNCLAATLADLALPTLESILEAV